MASFIKLFNVQLNPAHTLILHTVLDCIFKKGLKTFFNIEV